MFKRAMYVFLLILLFSNTSINFFIVYSTDYSSIGIGVKESIPQSLPWYPVIVFGDNRPDHSGEVEFNPVTYEMRDEFLVLNVFATIGVGDHVWNGYVDQIQHFIETFQEVPNVWVVAGNHEWNNKPYIDDSNEEGVTYWRQHVAPDLYYKDDIPGWRIVFINLRLGYIDWDRVENWVLNKAFNTDKHLMIVFHEPVAPKREASKAISEVQDKLIPILDEREPDIVVQGHIHCYYEGYKGSTLYLITGGGGAPKCSRYPYHYVVFTLKPNGSYEYNPVSTTDGEISVDEERSENSTHIMWRYLVENTKRDIYGYPTWMPVRINIEINGEKYGLVAVYGYGLTTVSIIYSRNNGRLLVEFITADKSQWSMYPPYIYGGGNVWIIDDAEKTIDLTQSCKTDSSSRIFESKTSGENDKSTSNTALSPHRIDHGLETETTNTTVEDNGSESKRQYVLIAIYVLIGIIAVETISIFKDKHR